MHGNYITSQLPAPDLDRVLGREGVVGECRGGEGKGQSEGGERQRMRERERLVGSERQDPCFSCDPTSCCSD